MSSSTKLPWKVRLLVGAFTFGVNASTSSNNMTVNRCLLRLFDPKLPSSPHSNSKGIISSDTTIDPSRNLWFRIYSPVATSNNLPIIIYIHGGGFCLLAPDSLPYDRFCRRLAHDIPAIVISINYQLAPENKFPCQLEDCFEFLKFIDASDELVAKADLTRCFIVGDSAGGNLAHHTVVRASQFEFNKLKIVGLIAIQPFFGGEERTEAETRLIKAPILSVSRSDWYWKAYLPNGLDRDHPTVNVFGPNAVDDISALTKFPITLVIIGGFDPLQDWQKRYYEGLKRSGKVVRVVEYSNSPHGFYGFPELPEFAMLITEIRDFMRDITN
ncbi:hypothetical protein UlMin_043318 [Ulmus minor]